MLGGHVVPKIYSGIPDYGVVPVHGAPLKYTVNEIVTDLFIVGIISFLLRLNSISSKNEQITYKKLRKNYFLKRFR